MRLYFNYLLLFILLLAFLQVDAQIQIRAGAKVAPGLGFIRSSNLKDYYNKIEEEARSSGANVNYNVTSRLRSHFAIGGFVEYKYSENIFFEAAPTLTFSSNKIISVYENDEVNDAGNGSVTRITSVAKIRSPYISLPLTGKFRVSHRREIFVFAGLSFNFHFTPKLLSEEELATIQYIDGVSESSSKQELDKKLKLKSYNFFNLNTVIGAGKVFNRYGRNILIDIRYSMPVTKSTLFAKGSNENLLLNSAFTEDGKSTASSKVPLDDFAMGVLSLNVSYTIYKNYR